MCISQMKPDGTDGQSPDEQLLSRRELISALELMMRRMEIIDSHAMGSFPLYSPEHTDRWVVSPGGSWIGGFWGAWWWLRSRLTESTADQSKAADICQRLSSKISVDSVNRSLIFWYGASLGALWFYDAHARKLTGDAIAVLAASYDPVINCIPLGTGMGGGKNGNRLITTDTFASLMQLLGGSGRGDHVHISQCHANTILTACHADDGVFHSAAHFEQGRFRPSDRAGVWSRGQAWTMLGLSRAAARWGEPYLAHARLACEYWKRSRPEPLPPNRLDNPLGLSDPSATVIASLAMLSLADLVSDGTQWRIHAHQRITAIVRSPYFTGFDENGDRKTILNRTAPGKFWGCCYKTKEGKDELVESAWGSFFLMAALCVLVGAVESNHC
jgi:unsaturated chondroitin disaccharide hydrolase